jgi:hypothetical protein
MKASLAKSGRFRFLQHVRVPFGDKSVVGTILEDRGPLGVEGRRLYTVEVYHDPGESTVSEFPEDEIEEYLQPSHLDRQAINDYLVQGGLIAMLRTNRGRHAPAVWLCLDGFGNVTHTTTPERGVVGGRVAPLWTDTADDRIYAPKVDQVVEFIQGFGFSGDEARSVVNQVGIS